VIKQALINQSEMHPPPVLPGATFRDTFGGQPRPIAGDLHGAS
jgi:hypothetical protein